MSAARDVFVDEQVDESLIDELRQRWAAEARAAGREAEARALEGRDAPPDAEAELLAAFRAEIEREFALAVMSAEPEAPQW